MLKVVNEWFENPHDNVGLLVKVVDSKKKKVHKVIETSHRRTDSNAATPFLQIKMKEKFPKLGARYKRNVALNCDESSQESRCCRYNLTIDFEEFGWDWIIAPKK